jgi:hypothetical protein
VVAFSPTSRNERPANWATTTHTMTSIRSLTSFKLDLPPSCIEFSPLHPQYAIIGTYNLEKPDEKESAGSAPHDGSVGKENQQRNGSLILVRVQGDDIVYVHCNFLLFFWSCYA